MLEEKQFFVKDLKNIKLELNDNCIFNYLCNFFAKLTFKTNTYIYVISDLCRVQFPSLDAQKTQVFSVLLKSDNSLISRSSKSRFVYNSTFNIITCKLR